MSNFDLSNLAIQTVCPGNEILYDDKNLPSIMVKIPKMTYAQLGMGESEDVFPAFIVDDQEVDAIWISKFQNVTFGDRAYSLPARDPRANITLEQAIAACAAKGKGWHCMTALEWGLMLRWCAQAGITPIGNNNYGKHSTESVYTGIPTTFASDGKINHIATGTGPLTYSHNHTPSGIFDLCGNVWEWAGGIRSVYGEVQVLADNNAANSTHSQTASSADWKAISAATGEYITPNGSGTTPGSVKMDYKNSAITYSDTITNSSTSERNTDFHNLKCDSTISAAAKTKLICLGFMPGSDTAEFQYNQRCYMKNGEAERCFFRGGYYSNTSSGFPSFCGYYARSASNTSVGFRSAYVEL